MTDTPQFSGIDLARQALATYKAASRAQPAPAPKARRKKVRRPGEGRDPITLAAAISGLGADLPLQAGVDGGTVLDQWPTLCPQYDGRVEPVAYDEQRGRLDLRPSTHAYAAQLRLLGGQLAKQINDKLGRPVVRTIRVLPVGNLTTPAPAPAVEEKPEAPVKTRDMASAGYHVCLQAALDHKPEPPAPNTYTQEALDRQEAAMRRGRQPESEHREGYWAQLEAQTGPRLRGSEAARRAAIAYKRREQAGLEPPRRAFDVA